MIRFLIATLAVLVLAGITEAKCGKRGKLFKGHIRTAVHNVVDAPFKMAESKPIRTTFGFTGGCANGQCQVKK